MAVVKVTDPGVGVTMTLDAQQTTMFIDELHRVTGPLSWSWLRELAHRLLPWSAGPLVAPDLVITVDDGADVAEYEVVGSYVLRERPDGAPHQFYFALLLFEWLEQQAAGPTP